MASQPTSEGVQPEGQPSGSTEQHCTARASPIWIVASHTRSMESSVLLAHEQKALESLAIVAAVSTYEQSKESVPKSARFVSVA